MFRSLTRDPRLALALSHLRLGDLARAIRRVTGFPVWNDRDYLVPLAAGESEALHNLALDIRGSSRRPAIFVHGPQPRSGTNFLANALSLHPAVHAFADDIYEFPLLHMEAGARALRNEILSLFPANEPKLRPLAPLALVASGWLRSLEQRHPEGRLLFKSPHVRGLSLFPSIFPGDRLVVCLRDGRDILASSEATFRFGLLRKSFRQQAHEWQQATAAVLQLAEERPPWLSVVRYEDLAGGGDEELERILLALDLDPAVYPFEQLRELPVFGSSSNDRKGDARWQPVERAKDFSPVGRWKNWPERKKRRYAAIAGATLERAGYV